MFSLFFDNTDIWRDLRFNPGGDLLGEFAERVVGWIYADNYSGIGPSERYDAAMVIEEPTDGFERMLNEREGFFEFHGVGFVEGHSGGPQDFVLS